MKTLAQVIEEKADPEQEPTRHQVVMFDGREVLMLCCLDRTAVLEVDGERVVVVLARIHVRRPARLRWQPREESRVTPAWRLNRIRYANAQASGRDTKRRQRDGAQADDNDIDTHAVVSA